MPSSRGDDLVIRVPSRERRTMFDDTLTEADRQYLRRVEEFCREKVDPHCARWDDEENLRARSSPTPAGSVCWG